METKVQPDEAHNVMAFMSSSEVARLAGLTQGRIRQLILAGEIEATKLAGRWFVRRDIALAWILKRRSA